MTDNLSPCICKLVLQAFCQLLVKYAKNVVINKLIMKPDGLHVHFIIIDYFVSLENNETCIDIKCVWYEAVAVTNY